MIIASVILIGAIFVGLMGRQVTAAPKGPVEQIDLDAGQAAVVLRHQLEGSRCEALLVAARYAADRQFVKVDVPGMGRFEVQQRRRGEFTVQPLSQIAATNDCRWTDRRIPNDPLRLP